MRRAVAFLALFATLSGCSSTRRERAWEVGAAGVTAADIASTTASHQPEGNPLFGERADPRAMLAVNAILYLTIRTALEDTPEEHRVAVWRAVTLFKILVVANNFARHL